MKLFLYAAAALTMVAGFTPAAVTTSADAAGQRYEHQRVVHRTVVRNERPRYRQRYRTRTVCRVVRRGGERRRVCRTVRR